MAELTSAIFELAAVCLKSYKAVSGFVKTMQQMGIKVADLEDRFTEEKTRLRVFIEAHNLLATQNGDIRPSPTTTMPPDWETAILARFVKIQEHFAKVHEVMDLYVETPPGNEPPQPKGAMTARTFSTLTSSSQLPPPELLKDLKVETEARLKRISRIQASKFKRKIEWSVRDQSKLTDAVDKLQEDNDALFRLSQPALLVLIAEGVSSLLRPRLDARDSALVAKYGSGDIKTGQHYHSEREFYTRLMREKIEARELLNQLDKETEEQKLARQIDVDRFPELSDSSLSPDPSTRTLTQYSINRGEEEEVLVEWRDYQNSSANHLQRISNVVAILNARPASLATPFYLHPASLSMRIPRAGTAGWASPTRRRHGPGTPHSTGPCEASSRVRQKSQKSIAEATAAASGLVSSCTLTRRDLLAIHTCNWLHKGLRPENMVFFGPPKSVAEPYLLGWGYSRSSDRWGDTERTAAWTNQEILYRDPDSFASEVEESVSSDATPQTPAPRPRYRMEFDQYQLGCLLLEIGKWDLLGTLRKLAMEDGRHVFPDGDHNRAWQSYLLRRAEKLKTDMGEIYANVTVSLLNGMNREGEEKEFWRDVVLALSQCHA